MCSRAPPRRSASSSRSCDACRFGWPCALAFDIGRVVQSHQPRDLPPQHSIAHTQGSLYTARSWHLNPHAGRWNELIDHGMLRSDSEADVSITMTDGAPTLERNTGPYCSRRPLPLTHPRRDRERGSSGDRDSVCVCGVCVGVDHSRGSSSSNQSASQRWS